jgi:PEP-CTERM motif
MTKLERARKFLTGTTRVIALKVIPLALVASSAHAAVPGNSFLLSSQSISTIQNSGGSGSFFGSGIFSASPLALENGFFGLSLTGSVGVSCSGGSCGGETIDFNFQGHVTGPATPPTTASVFYRFSTSLSGDTDSSYTWTFLGTGGDANYGANVTGNGVLNLSGSNWSMDLDITNPTFDDGATFTLTLPTDAPASIDLMAGPSAAPEPASMALTMAGAAGWLLLRRKNRRS